MDILAAVSRPSNPTPRVETVSISGPRADELRVRIVATGICHTDLHAHAGILSPLPIVLGHEGAGIVEAVGSEVKDIAVGDHVVLSGASCGQCDYCRIGLPGYCDTGGPRTFGGGRLDGSTSLRCGSDSLHSHFFGQSSFATYSIVPDRTAVKVDKDLPLETLSALACGVLTGAGSVIRALDVKAGDSIVVFGAGGVGLSAIMAARLVGAKHIVAVDVIDSRLDLALELGATAVFRADREDLAGAIRAVTGNGMQHAFNTTTVAATFDTALASLAVRGTLGFVAPPNGAWAPDMMSLMIGGRKLRGIVAGDTDPRSFIPMLIDYWRQGRFPFDKLLTFYPFGEIEQAFSAAQQGKAIKPILVMQ